MYAVHFRSELEEPTARELDALVAKLKAFLLLEHDESGHHNFDLMSTSVLDALQLKSQGEGQWWRTGPWRFDDPNAARPHRVGLRPPDPAAGTYHNYNPAGMEEAIILEIEPQGNITLTGLKALEGKDKKRLLLLRNRDSSATITLKDADTGSLAANRFDLPAISGTAGSGALLDASHNTDTVAQAVTRGSLIYGNSTPKWDELVIGAANRVLRSDGTDVAWSQVALATDVSGDLPFANLVQSSAISKLVGRGAAAGAGDFQEITLGTGLTMSATTLNGESVTAAAIGTAIGVYTVQASITKAQLEAINTSPVEIIAAPGAGKVVFPILFTLELTVTDAYTSSPDFSLRHPSATASITNLIAPAWTAVTTVIGQAVPTNRTDDVATFDRRNKAVNLFGSANPTGVGDATAIVNVVYYIVSGL